MSKKLFLEAMTKIIMGIIIIGLLIFIPAGSIEFFNGWLFIILLFVPMFVAGIFMMINNPELLKRRLNAKEKEGEQKEVVALSGIMFIVGFIIAGLNYRYNWMELSNTIVIIGSIIFLLSYFLYAIVLIQNEYLLRTIEVEKDQKLVDTGLYGIIRHPMYLATISLFLSMPLILGSFYSFIIFLAYLFIIV
jgi:protein-S-isoprenylcysteine O-methyltransferase Ste14